MEIPKSAAFKEDGSPAEAGDTVAYLVGTLSPQMFYGYGKALRGSDDTHLYLIDGNWLGIDTSIQAVMDGDNLSQETQRQVKDYADEWRKRRAALPKPSLRLPDFTARGIKMEGNTRIGDTGWGIEIKLDT